MPFSFRLPLQLVAFIKHKDYMFNIIANFNPKSNDMC